MNPTTDELILINLNGKDYISHAEYKKLNDKLIEKSEQDYKKVCWIDPAHVLAMFIAYASNEDKPEVINFNNLTFKLPEKVILEVEYGIKEDLPSLKFNGTKYSKEYINLIEKRGKILTGEKPIVLMSYDITKKEFKKNEPIMFLFDNIAFVLAPRVDNDNE